MSFLYRTSLFRTQASRALRPSTTTFLTTSQSPIQSRLYAHQSYGGGEGDPKGENPQDQGANPSADKEHPGPAPVTEGQGTGGGPTKKHADGHNTGKSNEAQRSSSDGSSAASSSGSSGGGSGASGAKPKIHAESQPAELSEEARKHNEAFEQRHDRAANEADDDEKQKVGKGFWKVLALAAESTVASTWFSKAAYNKWHETELERWLSDNNVPYPTPADRKDLEKLVKSNWEGKVVKPYSEWDTPQLQSFLKSKGADAKKASASNKDSLINSVKGYWTETADTADSSYSSMKDWIFDSWTDSQLKLFLDKHSIPAPQPRKRDTMIKAARENYESLAKKLGETAAYPGDWLYSTWSESDLKEFLDERGVPVPQPSTRDKLIASVRRNSRLASVNLKESAASASSSAAAAQKSLSDALLDSWSDSQIKEWADKNGIKVPQGSKRNELIALARKHRNAFTGESAASSVSSAYGAASSKAGNEFAQATDDASLKAQDTFDAASGTWSDSRLKAFLDARGVPVPQAGKRDELMKQVRLNQHKAATGWSAWTFDTWTTDNLKNWLKTQNNKAYNKAGLTRDDLLKQAQDSYASASKSGGSNYASATSYLASATDSVKDTTFDTWSESDLKSYLDSYGVPNYQGSTTNELKAMARRNSNYFRYGSSTPQGTIFSRISNGAQWVLDQLKIGASSGSQEAGYNAQKGADAAKEAGTKATNRAGEAAQQATDKVKEEL
ncbi:hypothetical protein MMC25_006026 [Agyrium rufum]|nr:hypothetical protein [Agyrium rufum]